MKHVDPGAKTGRYPYSPPGHYRLNLANPFDAVILKKIAETATDDRVKRQSLAAYFKNTSQKGDWDSACNFSTLRAAAILSLHMF